MGGPTLPPHLLGRALTEEVLAAELARLRLCALELTASLAAGAAASASGNGDNRSGAGPGGGPGADGGDGLEAFMAANAAAEAAQKQAALASEQAEVIRISLVGWPHDLSQRWLRLRYWSCNSHANIISSG